MNAFRTAVCWIIMLTLSGGRLSAAAQDERKPLLLLDFGSQFKADTVTTSDAQAAVTEAGTLRVQTGHAGPWPGVTLKAPAGKWDLSSYETITLDINNRGGKSLTVNCRVDNPDANGTDHCITGHVAVDPNATAKLTVRIFPVPWKLDKPLNLIGMRAAPTHAGKLNTANVTQLVVFVNQPQEDHVFEIDNIRASGQIRVLDSSTFLPFIDPFGQYVHKEWPGKTHSIEELIAYGRAEKQDLEMYPGPDDRDQYGGWASGPQLKATGFFRVQKHKDKWWLVDPNGKLFWSHGIDCVGSGNATPISDRENYCQDLPGADSPFAQFYGTGSWAPHGYYKDHSPYKTYDFSRANLRRKYGESFEHAFADITHHRLRSWGINTIANWSNASIYLMRKTPYVTAISFEAKRVEGSQGYWGKFYDVFDPSFRAKLRERLESQKDRTAGDPWCLGYFVHNELAWGDDTSLAVAALVSPAEQPAKKVFIDDLKAKYETIEKLNEAWGTGHASWEALLQNQKAPGKQKARADLTAFYTKTAETYFATIRDELKKVAPNQLYLGCRFSSVNDRAARAAAKFCDIVCYNRYEYSVAELKLPDDIDMPLIIGEFHFGALDRGMFHTGLRRTENQQDRADKYASYVRGALTNPYIVGTHWFQYKDQATTGRGDGENYQIGFIDICDKPYPEIVRAARDVGYGIYEYRIGNN
jgi:glycosyl hydrolase family 42 (putative beta-galactosidase)